MPHAASAAAVRPIDIESVDPGRSVGWWADAGALFVRDPLRWTALAAVLIVPLALAAPLLVLGAALAAATLGMDLVSHALGIANVLGAVPIDAPTDAAARAALGGGMLALLLLLTFSLVVSAALWFAPALVVLHGATPRRAAAASLRAVRDNALTFLLFAVVQLLISAAVLVLHEAAWLVLLPVLLHTGYLSYRDVFDR